jgi:hypothetical protein
MELIQKSARLYANCMSELKFRIAHAERMLTKLPERDSKENRILVAENIALQFRKAIELIALASIAANETQYARIRAEFHRDWNARLIFRDIERLNPKFYPKPIAGLSDPEYEGGPSIIEEFDDGFLDQEMAMGLYDKCASVLHADNPYSGKTDYQSILQYFSSQVPLLKTLLSNFWVYLVLSHFCNVG